METECRKITKAMHKKILREWGELFPELGLHSVKQAIFFKRIGPLMPALRLEFRTSQGEYNPMTFLLNMSVADTSGQAFGSPILDRRYWRSIPVNFFPRETPGTEHEVVYV